MLNAVITTPEQDYKYHSLCKVCTARDHQGNPLREQVDGMIARGERNRKVIAWLKLHGIEVTERNFSRHLNKHSLFAKKGRETMGVETLLLQEEVLVREHNVKEALQRIINIGDSMVETGEMPVTEKMYVQALKEGNKPQFSSIGIEELLRQMDRNRFTHIIDNIE